MIRRIMNWIRNITKTEIIVCVIYALLLMYLFYMQYIYLSPENVIKSQLKADYGVSDSIELYIDQAEDDIYVLSGDLPSDIPRNWKIRKGTVSITSLYAYAYPV